MMSLPLDEPRWVASPEDLQELAKALAANPLIAVDTESNSLYAYHEQVCLIQFSIPGADYLVDPLVLADLSLLGPIFENPNIEKIFHAAEYDLICMKRDFGFIFNTIFDTMLASRILGKPYYGLVDLLSAEFEINLDKRFQRADWAKRPLPASHLAYARLDSHFLIDLRNRLKEELEDQGLFALAREDFNHMSKVSPSQENGQSSVWRVAGSRDVSPEKAAVLQELCAYRDFCAQKANRPLFKVFSDDTLLQIALAVPQNVKELTAAGHLNPWQVRKYGNGLLHAIERGMQSQPLERPTSVRPDAQFLSRLEGLREWRKVTGRQRGVESDVILPRDAMEAIARHNPHSKKELAAIMKDFPWRVNYFGDQILEILSKLET
jgi:ribonuclease D